MPKVHLAIYKDMPKDYVPSQFFRLSVPPKVTFCDYNSLYPYPAQQSVHLTAFGVGMLAILAGYVVFLFKLLRKFGGK